MIIVQGVCPKTGIDLFTIPKVLIGGSEVFTVQVRASPISSMVEKPYVCVKK